MNLTQIRVCKIWAKKAALHSDIHQTWWHDLSNVVIWDIDGLSAGHIVRTLDKAQVLIKRRGSSTHFHPH